MGARERSDFDQYSSNSNTKWKIEANHIIITRTLRSNHIHFQLIDKLVEPDLFIDTTDNQVNSLGTLPTMTYGRQTMDAKWWQKLTFHLS